MNTGAVPPICCQCIRTGENREKFRFPETMIACRAVCLTCGVTNHPPMRCPRAMPACARCGRHGHRYGDCRIITCICGAPLCRNCNASGHSIDDCPFTRTRLAPGITHSPRFIIIDEQNEVAKSATPQVIRELPEAHHLRNAPIPASHRSSTATILFDDPLNNLGYASDDPLHDLLFTGPFAESESPDNYD